MKRAGTSQSLSPTTSAPKRNCSGKMLKSNGKILFRLNKFKEFSERGTSVRSDTVEYINGLPYYLLVNHWEDKVDISIVSEVDAETDANIYVTYDSIGTTMYPGALTIDIESLISNVEEDSICFEAEINADKVVGIPSNVPANAVLLVNRRAVYVNSELLADCSTFFETLFFAENAEAIPKVQIDDVPDAVATFERLLATMGQNAELDDECIENVFMLAKRFSLRSVEKHCVEFLLKKSEKTAICKFRLAHPAEKELFLKAMTEKDFSISLDGGYAVNIHEIRKLTNAEVEALIKRQKELFEGLIDAADLYGGLI